MDWNATTYFKNLTNTNRLAREHEFVFCSVTTLESLEETLHLMQNSRNFICVSEMEQGYTDINNAPHTRRIKTVYLMMRHPLDDMQRRQQCIDTMNELFRQFCSHLIRERTRLAEQRIYLDPRIRLNEIDRYMLTGCACMYFQIAADVSTDLRFNPDEWIET